jgi:hypothetical protein
MKTKDEKGKLSIIPVFSGYFFVNGLKLDGRAKDQCIFISNAISVPSWSTTTTFSDDDV